MTSIKGEIIDMRTARFFYFTFILLLTAALFLPSSSAQDYTRWHLPEGAIARFGKGTLTDCVYFPDGHRLAVLSSIGIWIYDARTGEELDLITEPFTEDMHLSPDGKTLAAATDGSVYLWDIHTNKLKSVLVGDTHGIHSLAFSPTGETLASANWNNEIQLWDVHTGELLKTFVGHTDRIYFIAHSNGGKMLASVGWEDNTIRIWDMTTGQLLKIITEASKKDFLVLHILPMGRHWRVRVGIPKFVFGISTLENF